MHKAPSGVTIPTMPTLHPAYLLRNPAHKKLAWRDFRSEGEAAGPYRTRLSGNGRKGERKRPPVPIRFAVRTARLLRQCSTCSTRNMATVSAWADEQHAQEGRLYQTHDHDVPKLAITQSPLRVRRRPAAARQ